MVRTDEKSLFTVKDAANVLNVSRMTVYRLMGSGKLAAKKLGGRTVIPSEALRDFIDSLPEAETKAYG